MVSLIDHVVMNHQNHTRTNGIWGHVRYNKYFAHKIVMVDFLTSFLVAAQIKLSQEAIASVRWSAQIIPSQSPWTFKPLYIEIAKNR
jgi:hypothetical protein